MPPRVLGVELPHSEAELTPQSEQLRQTLRDEEERRKRNDRELSTRLTELEKKVVLSTHLQWIVALVVGFCTAWLTYRAATQEDKVASSILPRAEALVDSKLREHLQAVSQTSLDIAVQAVRIRDTEIEASKNPPPIGRQPDRLSSSRPKR